MAEPSNTGPAGANPLAPGKLPMNLLGDLLAALPTDDPAVLLGPTVGEDAAVIDFTQAAGDHLLVAKSDPITFATDAIGYYAVNVCANDLAVTGATPRFYLPTLLLPVGVDTSVARTIFAQIGDACARLNIVVVGGHSEVTHTVNQPVVAGTLLGTVPRSSFVASSGCQPGDAVLMAGSAPVEGVSIIAREKRTDLLAAGWEATRIDQAADYLYKPGISVLAPAHAAAATGRVHAMHDPTEGGIATGLAELALAADVGMEIDLDAIPILPLARDLCAAFGLDPLGTIASGALLATCAQADVPTMLAAWRDQGWDGCVIGRVTQRGGSLVAHRGGVETPFPTFTADEITKLWT